MRRGARRSIGDKIGEAQTLVNLSKVFITQGDMEQAKAYLEDSKKEYQEAGYTQYESSIQNVLDEIAEYGAFELSRNGGNKNNIE